VVADLERLGFRPGSQQAFPKPVDFAGLDVHSADLIPRWLGALMALLAAAVLAHVLTILAVTRRRELATLRTLGFARRQVRATLAWGGSTFVLAASAFGAIVGVVLGRVAWSVYARRIDVLVEPVTPWVGLLLIVAGAFVFANLVALVVGRDVVRR